MPVNPVTGAYEEDEYDTTGAIQGALASLAAGFQGKDSLGAVNQVMNQRRQAKQDEISALEKWKQAKRQELQDQREATKFQREDDKYALDQEKLKREMDVTSEDSKLAQQLAKSMGYAGDVSNLSAAKFREFSPIMQKKFEIEQRKLDRNETRQIRNDLNRQKLDEKQQGLKTPYGLANTEDDAKKLKEAHESKINFDAKIQEMINLRKKYGAETLNREAVARGEQLSKDLLLEYKNMAKLGVLSASDEAIINAIIPTDPLALKTFEALSGQDSILSNLEKFKKDSDRDFQTRIGTRTREGIANQKNQTSQGKEIVKTQTNTKTGEKRIVYSDGSFEIIPSVAGGG